MQELGGQRGEGAYFRENTVLAINNCPMALLIVCYRMLSRGVKRQTLHTQ